MDFNPFGYSPPHCLHTPALEPTATVAASGGKRIAETNSWHSANPNDA
jgi:hypothetical protein